MKLSRNTKIRLFISTLAGIGAIYCSLTIEKLPPILGGGCFLIGILCLCSLCELIFPSIRKQLAELDAKSEKEHEQIIENIKNISPQNSQFSWKGLSLLFLVLAVIAVFIICPSIFLVYLLRGDEFNASAILLVILMCVIILLFSVVFLFALIVTIVSWIKGAKKNGVLQPLLRSEKSKEE